MLQSLLAEFNIGYKNKIENVTSVTGKYILYKIIQKQITLLEKVIC